MKTLTVMFAFGLLLCLTITGCSMFGQGSLTAENWSDGSDSTVYDGENRRVNTVIQGEGSYYTGPGNGQKAAEKPEEKQNKDD